jgi:HSP20 family molecular chaperone IbpA
MTTALRHHPSVVDDERAWTIALDVADFTPGELRVEVDRERLTVTADRPPIGPLEIREHLDESLRLPTGLEPETARAIFDDGVLRIQVPKRPRVHRVIPVERAGAIRINADATPC